MTPSSDRQYHTVVMVTLVVLTLSLGATLTQAQPTTREDFAEVQVPMAENDQTFSPCVYCVNYNSNRAASSVYGANMYPSSYVEPDYVDIIRDLVSSLRRDNAALRQENVALKEDHARVQGRVDEITRELAELWKNNRGFHPTNC